MVDRTPWPSNDVAGNSLKHTEVCAWRFGGECDCRPDPKMDDKPIILDKSDQIRAFVWLQIYYKLKLEVDHPGGPKWRESPMKQAKAVLLRAGIDLKSNRKRVVFDQYDAYLRQTGVLR